MAKVEQYRSYDRWRYRQDTRQEWFRRYQAQPTTRERRRAYMAVYYAERKAEWRAKYRTPQKDAEYAAQRRSFVLSGGTFIVLERDWRRLVARYRGLCAYCQERPWQHREHVVPLSRGGWHSIGNLLPACAECNFDKKARLLMEWPR